jgi:hypothetical protein
VGDRPIAQRAFFTLPGLTRTLAAISLFGISGVIAPHTAAAEERPSVFRFVQSRHATGGENPFAVAIVDMTGDGRPDLAVTHAGSSDVTILENVGGRFEGRRGRFEVGRVPRGLVSADLDGDGNQDLVIAGGHANTVELLLGDGSGSGLRRTLGARIAPFNVTVADLNADGRLDIAVANESNLAVLREKGEVSIFFGDGSRDFTPGPTLRAGTHPADIEAAELNGDGHVDLAVVNWGSRDVVLYFGRGSGDFSAALSIPHGGVAAYSLDVADLDGDGDTDLVVGDAGGDVRIFENDGGGTFEVGPVLAADRGLRSVVIADLNGDGLPDIATANAAADNVSLFLSQGGGTFLGRQNVRVGKHPRNVAAGDLNADGKVDLVVTNIEEDDLSVLLNAGGSSPGLP